MPRWLVMYVHVPMHSLSEVYCYCDQDVASFDLMKGLAKAYPTMINHWLVYIVTNLMSSGC